MRLPYIIATIVAVSCLVAIPGSHRAPVKVDPRILSADRIDHTVDYSNIMPGDYTGPAVCAECHDEQHELWLTHPHSRMNRLPCPSSIQGDFNNAVLELPTGKAIFSIDDRDRYIIEVFKDGQQRRLYEVTRTVGSRYMQAYIGRQLKGPEPRDHDIYQEHRLPFGYWFKMARWLPRVYLNAYGDETLVDGVPIDESIDATPQVDTYGSNCMNCHNTYPYAYRIYHSYLAGFPDATVSAEINQLSQAISKQLSVQPTIKSFMNLNERLDPDEHLVTLGISCESCHFGGREHAVREREIKFLPTSKLTRISADDPRFQPTGDRDNALTTRGICTQCHSGRADLFPNGAGKGNSREGLDLAAGSCASKLSCVDCHEPHTGTPVPSGGPDLDKHVNLCASCHAEYQDTRFASLHSGHADGSVNCLDCHMPRYTRGVDSLIRTHRISLPVEPTMIAGGYANACNACHLDKSLRWTLDQHERMWGKRLAPVATWKSINDLDTPSIDVWLASQDSHMRFLATQWLARSQWAKQRLADVANSLNDPEPVNRVFASFAVSEILGQSPSDPIQVDITAAPQERLKQIQQWLYEFGHNPAPSKQ